MSLFRSNKRKFDSETERIWIKYFQGSGKPIVLPQIDDSKLVELVSAIRIPSVPKEEIYDKSEPSLDNRQHLLALFHYNEPVSIERRDLLMYLEGTDSVLGAKNRVWRSVSRLVMQALLHFFYKYSEAASLDPENAIAIGGFSADDALYVSVALRLPKDEIQDVLESLVFLFNHMLSPGHGFPREPMYRAFVLRCANSVLARYRDLTIDGVQKTAIFDFVWRYFVCLVSEIHQSLLREEELIFGIDYLEFLTVTVVHFKPSDYLDVAELTSAELLRFFKNILACRHLEYNNNIVYALGMRAISTLSVFCDPSRKRKVSVIEQPEIIYLILFAVWGLDCFGFVSVPEPLFPFVKEPIRYKDSGRFEFREYPIVFDEDGVNNWHFVPFSLDCLHQNCIDALNKIVFFLRSVTTVDVALEIIWRVFSPESHFQTLPFAHPKLIGFYVLFIICYFAKQANCVPQVAMKLDDLFARVIFDKFIDVDDSDYGKRMFFRNYLFQVLCEISRFAMHETVMKLLSMFNSPMSVGLEIASFLSELLHVYKEKLIQCLSLSCLFDLDQGLEQGEHPGREIIFHFLNELIMYRGGVELLLGHEAFVHRLIDCTFDKRVMSHSFKLLYQSIEQVSSLDIFCRVIACTKKVLQQAIDEGGELWIEYLKSFCSFVSVVLACFRRSFGSKQVMFPGFISLLITLTSKVSAAGAVEVTGLLVEIVKALATGDTRYRAACASFYQLSLFPLRVDASIVRRIISLVYEVPISKVRDGSWIKNPDALALLHVSLVNYPKAHKEAFVDVFAHVKRALENQVVLVQSEFFRDMLQFIHDQPDHESNEIFVDVISVLLSNFFELKSFQSILKLGMTSNWERVITTVSERTSGFKPFVYLQGGDTGLWVKCSKTCVETFEVQFTIPHLPASDCVLASLGDPRGNCVDVVVQPTGILAVLTHKKGAKDPKEVPTSHAIAPGVDYHLVISVSTGHVVISISDFFRVEAKGEVSANFVMSRIGVGSSLRRHRGSMPMTIYNISARGDRLPVFSSDCSVVRNHHLINMIDTTETLSVKVVGLCCPRRLTITESLIEYGGLFDLVIRTAGEHSVVFLVKLLNNLIRNEPTFEQRLFEFARETAFFSSITFLDRSWITMDYVLELYSMTKSLKDEANIFFLYENCWFVFSFWNESNVFNYVYETVLPEIMERHPKFVAQHLTLDWLLTASTDISSFWHVICLYMLQTQRSNELSQLKGHISRTRPMSFFMNLFGVSYRSDATTDLLHKLSSDDISCYYELFFCAFTADGEGQIVTEDIFMSFVRFVCDASSPAVTFDVAMLLSERVPWKCLRALVHRIVEIKSHLLEKVLESQQLHIWLAFIVLRQLDVNTGMNKCDFDVIELITLLLVHLPNKFREFSRVLMASSVGRVEPSSVLQLVFMSACTILQERCQRPDIEILTIITEYLLFVARAEIYSKNLPLAFEMNGVHEKPSTNTKPLSVSSFLESIKQHNDLNLLFLSNRLRITIDGTWSDCHLVEQFLGLLRQCDNDMEIAFSENQSVKLCHLYSYLLQLLMTTKSRMLWEVLPLVSDKFGSNWDAIDDLSVRLLLFGAFKRMLRDPAERASFPAFLSMCQYQVKEDAQMNGRTIVTDSDMVEMLANSYAESNYMWMRLLDNFCVVTFSNQKQLSEQIYAKFPFMVVFDQTGANDLDSVSLLVRHWVSLRTAAAMIQSKKQEIVANMPVLDKYFQPVCVGRSPLVFVPVDYIDPVISEDRILCNCTVRVFDQEAHSFIFCDHNHLVIAGIRIPMWRVMWVVGHSNSEMTIYTTNGQLFGVSLGKTVTCARFYTFLDRSQLLLKPGLRNMDIVVRLNIMNGNSYNTDRKMVFPTLVKSKLSETQVIGTNWHFVRQMINTIDMSEWFKKFFGQNHVESRLVRDSIHIDVASMPLLHARFLFVHNDRVLALIPDAENGSTIAVIKTEPKLKVSTKMWMKVPCCQSTKLCFFDEFVFVLYTPSSKLIKICRKTPDDELKVLSVVAIYGSVESFMKVDAHRIVARISSDTLYLISLIGPDSTANVNHIFVNQRQIIASTVNTTLNLLATLDSSGKVILTSLASLTFVKSVTLDITSATGIQLLSCGIIIISQRDGLQSFDLDGVCLCRTNDAYAIAGVHDEILAVISSNNLMFLDPSNLYVLKHFALDHPITQCLADPSIPYALIYDDRNLVQVKINM